MTFETRLLVLLADLQPTMMVELEESDRPTHLYHDKSIFLEPSSPESTDAEPVNLDR